MTGRGSPARYDARVSGRVQRVGFRAFCRRSALSLGLRGWVRNLPGRSVEVCVVGERLSIDLFIRLLRAGPAGAKVERVDGQFSEPSGNEPEGFCAM